MFECLLLSLPKGTPRAPDHSPRLPPQGHRLHDHPFCASILGWVKKKKNGAQHPSHLTNLRQMLGMRWAPRECWLSKERGVRAQPPPRRSWAGVPSHCLTSLGPSVDVLSSIQERGPPGYSEALRMAGRKQGSGLREQPGVGVGERLCAVRS